MRYHQIAESAILDLDPQVTRVLFDLDLKAARGVLTVEDHQAFSTYLRRHKMDRVKMYHGTSVRHAVRTQGLLPTSTKRRLSLQSGSGYVYLSYDPQRALSFARYGYTRDTALVVYAVTVGIWMLRPDPDQLRNKRMWGDNKDIGNTLTDSLIYGGGARIRGLIPSSDITVHGYFDKEGNRIGRPDSHDWQ